MYHLNCTDISRLIRACEIYKDWTGSEHMWEQYDDLIQKLKLYSNQNLLECDTNGNNGTTKS